jgi:hypothetical protein
MRRLVVILLHLPFGLEQYGAIFHAVVDIIAMVHAVWRLEWILAMASSSA